MSPPRKQGINRMRSISIRVCLFSVIALCGRITTAGDTNVPTKPLLDAKSGIAWYDVSHLRVEGKGWTDTESFFDRLPARAKGIVRDKVWDLSRDSTGISVRFVTDATEIHVDWTLTQSQLSLPHMPSSGASGVDLYVRLPDGKWRWLANAQPRRQSTKLQIAGGLPAGSREFRLYLPLYNGVARAAIGVSSDKSVQLPDSSELDERKPIVFYGTSITHGACASRPGMTHVAIIGRRLQYPIINLGFSGNGRMEAEIATLLAELDPAVFVIDCLPNLLADGVRERAENVVSILRKAHPNTPILLVEDRTYPNGFLVASTRKRNETSRAELRKVYEKLIAAGDRNLFYLEGEKLLSEDGEDTVDNSHPTDLGFAHQAEAFLEVLRPILSGGSEP